ncbi:3-deoxy-manno-octulosonate cytidylyltransferase [mine drainage metagenome]|uniref:3-deoxy-manno-octulosonate cytidylyltransferase n=1 Tax=mine drainage metagenome TaxID=410659 RepID=A0A1J5QR72_9ZZZZ
MSETVQNIESEDIPHADSSVGKMLSVAREAAGMSIEDAAARLRLSVYQVRALEAGMRIDITIVDTVPRGVDTPADIETARRVLHEIGGLAKS